MQSFRHYDRYHKGVWAASVLFIICIKTVAPESRSHSKANANPTNLFQEGEIYRTGGDYPNSIAAYQKSLKASRQLKDLDIELKSLLGLGISYWNIGTLDLSKEYYLAARNIANRAGRQAETNYSENCLLIYSLYQQGKESRTNNRLNESVDYFKKAISLSKEISSPDHEVKCLRQLSVIYWDQGNIKEFFILNSAALEIAIIIKNIKEEGRCLNNLGLYHWKIDNYSASLNYYEKSLSIAESQKNAPDQADTLHNIGIIWTYLGNYENAIEYLMRAYSIDKTLSNPTNLASDLNTIGMALIKRGLLSESNDDIIKSLDYFLDALRLAKEAKDKKETIVILNNIGSAKSHLRFYSEALGYFQNALKQAKEIGDLASLGMIYNNIGIVYANMADYAESSRYYQNAINLALGVSSGDVLWEAYFERGNSFRAQNKFTEALSNYENSIHVIEEIRSNLIQEELKASYLGSSKRIDAYQNTIDLLSEIGIEEQNVASKKRAFNTLEKAKARAFLDSLEVSEVNVSTGINPRLANQEKELMQEISQLYTKLLMPSIGETEKTTITGQIRKLEEKQDNLKREIRTTSPAYANLKYPEVITYDEAMKTLVDDVTSYFAYSLGKDRSFVFVLNRAGLKVFEAPPRKVLQQQVADYRKAISDRDNREFGLGRVLYDELVRPGLDGDAKRLIFVPDDVLNLLPFEALISDPAGPRWLVKDHAVVYVPSLSSLRELNTRRAASQARPHKDLLAFGDPYYGVNEENSRAATSDLFKDFFSNASVDFFRLKYSGLEVQRISSAFKASRVDAFRREQATEDRLKSEPLTDYRIIHFAAHGLIDDKKPARSSIILALDQDPNEDGFLQMREIFNLRLAADLVTLSACQTGLGQFIRGEGVEGLSRAFFYAGASSVLMSLWAVNDEATYQLMERFYGHLKGSETAMNALRRAKLEMIDSGVLSHPYYWAGFIVNGKSDSVIFPRTLRRRVLIAGSLFAGIALLAALRGLNRRKA